MKILSIELENFIPFKGESEVEFSNGLNLICGSIGSGKSNFFNAFYWCLFNKIYITDEGWLQPEKEDVINASVFDQLKENQTAKCKVELVIEKREDDSKSKAEYKISRSFEIKKTSDGSEIVKSDFDLYFDDIQGDDVVSDEFASSKIESDIFPEVLSEYVWFQGESLDKLIDLDQSSSFKKVIDSISYLDIYDTIIEVLKITDTKLDRALRKKLMASKANEKELHDAQFYIESSKRKLESNKAKVIQNAEDIDKYRVKRTELEEKLAARDDTEQLINERKSIKIEFEKIVGQIANLDDQYKKKFVESWMIKGLGSHIVNARDKMAEFKVWRAKEIDKEQDLPEDVPGDQYLNRMLNEEKCMICGRSAEEGTHEHSHIKSLLNRKSKSVVLAPEIERLNNNIGDINPFVNQILSKHDRINNEIIEWRKSDKELREKKQLLIIEKEKIDEKIKNVERRTGIKVDESAISARKALSLIKEYEAKITQLSRENRVLEDENYKALNTIKKYKSVQSEIIEDEGIEIVEEGQLKRIEQITGAVEKTIKKEYNLLIEDIEDRTNKYIDIILSHNTSIRAKVDIDPDSNSISIIDENDQDLDMLNTGHKTIIKMSIINSIITKSTEYKEQPYPFITDAPTSSLGQKDTESYLKLVSEIFEQSIVLSKDFEESINSIGDQISIGTIHNLIPVNIDTSIDSSLTNTYTKITKI